MIYLVPYFDFPIEITHIETVNGLYPFGPACTIVIWRNDDFKLQAKINGFGSGPFKLTTQTEDGNGHFALTETITGFGKDRFFRFTLHECVVTNYKEKGVYYPNFGVPFEADLSLDYFTTEFMYADGMKEPTAQFDWFLANQFNINFRRRTAHKLIKKYTRTRINEEPEEEKDDPLEQESSGSSWDFFAINIPAVKCIIGLVPPGFGPAWAKCLVIEYQKSDGIFPGVEIKMAVKNLIGFLLRSDLFHIGSTVFNRHTIITQYARSSLVCSRLIVQSLDFHPSGLTGNINGEILNGS